MLRESALNTKRFELIKCAERRKRKLSELYHVTQIATDTEALSTTRDTYDLNKHSQLSESDFQDANDITKSRAFDVATLLRIPGFKPAHASTTFHNTAQHREEANGKDAKEPGHESNIHVAQSASRSSQTQDLDDLDETITVQLAPKGIHAGMPAAHDPFENINDDMDGILNLRPDDEESKDAIVQGLVGGRDSIKGTRPLTPLGSSPLHNPPKESQKMKDGLRPASTYQQFPKQLSPTRSLQVKTPSEDGATQPLMDRLVLQPAKSTSSNITASSLTPDAQLHQEAAQFMDSQPQTDLRQRKDTENIHDGQETDQDTAQRSGVADTVRASQDNSLASRRQGMLRDQRLEGMASETSKDVMLSQRPPMRIDTAVGRPQVPDDTLTSSTAFTPLKTAAGMHSSPPERMTTRVASGAMRHKSVTEILGGTPRTAASYGDRTPVESGREDSQYLSRRASLVGSPESASFKSRLNELKERENDRSKLSTVVFARSQLGNGVSMGSDKLGHAAGGSKSDHEKDYLVPLFAAQATAQTPTLSDLIRNRHKTLSTSNHYVEYHELQDCRILKRIYHLQNSNRWSLRQLERSAEPPRPNSHWDTLLNEVTWMRTDFREERKWKATAARNLAEMCAEWVLAPVELRLSLQVRVTAPATKPRVLGHHSRTASSNKANGSILSEATPELVPSGEDEMSDVPEELPHLDMSRTIAPAALFSLAPEDVLFSIDKTPAADRLLSELPLYRPFEDPRGKKRSCSEMLDASWKTPIVAVSKYTLGKMVIKDHGPPRKRDRYNYVDEDEAEYDSAGRTLLPLDQKKEPLPPEKDDVALFNPKNKHIIARLHAAHAFRPPSEFAMPHQQFFESRSASQWTQAEDDELKRLVREYEYNWSLISACLSSQSLFSSGAERRTPWECFERWEMSEGLPGDMDKHSYFRAWKSRRLGAKQHLEQLFNAQQASGNTAPMRRKTAEPVRVERRRNNKHLALIHAMSKVAKKKETTIQKQQHAASMAAMRKASEPTSMRLRMQTPQEFSAHKHKQELEFKEKQALYRQQVIANQRALLTQKAGQQSGQQQGGPGVSQPGRMAVPGPMNGNSPHLASSLPHNSTTQSGARPLPPSQAMLNGVTPNGPAQNGQLGMRGGMSQPQMQYIPGQPPRVPTQSDPDRVIMEASRLQEQQRLMQQRQYQTQANGTNGVSPIPHNAMTVQQTQQLQASAAMMGNIQPNGKPGSSSGAPGQHRLSGSPPMAVPAQNQQLSNGTMPLLNQITNSLKAMHPNASPEQIKSLATANLNQHLRTQNQNSQAGNNIGSGSIPQQAQGAGYSQGMNPQMYAQYMRSQQASQSQNKQANETNGARPDSRGGTSQTKGGSTHSGASQSPRPPQAQKASSS